MFLYNIFPKGFELSEIQAIVVYLILLTSSFLALVLIKQRPGKKIAIISIFLGVALSFLSLSVGHGVESGFDSKMGWPFYFVGNNQGLNTSIVSILIDPKNHWYLLIDNFIFNSFIYIFSILNISWFLSIRTSIKSLKIHVLPLLTLFALLVLSIFCFINVYEKSISNFSSLKLPDDDTEQKLEPRARYLVETKYPEFKDYEKQQSFAGKIVFSKTVGNSIYFAYVVSGSGVPIADATCFKVEDLQTVSQIGKMIRPTPGNDGMIDPVTCRVN